MKMHPTGVAVFVAVLALAVPAGAFTMNGDTTTNGQSPTGGSSGTPGSSNPGSSLTSPGNAPSGYPSGSLLTDPGDAVKNYSNGLTTQFGDLKFGLSAQPPGQGLTFGGRGFSPQSTVGAPPSTFQNLFPNTQ